MRLVGPVLFFVYFPRFAVQLRSTIYCPVRFVGYASSSYCREGR